MAARLVNRVNTLKKKKTLIYRVKTLKKKTFELSTLCGVDAVLIICENDGPNSVLHTWPESRQQVCRILQSYPDRKGLDLQRRQPRKQRKISDVNLDGGDQAEMINNATHENSTVENASAEDAKMFLGVLDSKLSTVNARIRELKGAEIENLDTKAICETSEWEGIQCCGGTEVGSCSVTASDWDWEALLEDQTISPLQFLMDGPNFDMGYDPLFLSHFGIPPVTMGTHHSTTKLVGHKLDFSIGKFWGGTAF